MIFLYLEEEKWIQKKRKSLHANEAAPYDLVFRDSFAVVKICIMFMEMVASYSFPFYPHTVCALHKTLF